MAIIGVKVLLVPTKEKMQAFYDSAYYADLMYNEALRWNQDYYKASEGFYTFIDMSRMLPEFKREHPEFAGVPCGVLQNAVLDLRKAFQSFGKGITAFPRAKVIGRNLSFGTGKMGLSIGKNTVRLPKIGEVKCKHCHWYTRNMSEVNLRTAVHRKEIHDPRVKFDGKYWFLSFGIDAGIEPEATTDEVIGIDLGINHTMVCSDGTVFENINKTRQVRNLVRRQKRLQRKISHKYEVNKRSATEFVKTRNIKKLERQVRYIYRKLRNIREDYNQRITNAVVNKLPERIMLEDLRIKNLIRNRHLSRVISEQNFYRLRQLLIWKAKKTLGVQVCVIPNNYPSTKRCHNCGAIWQNMRLSNRVYVCDQCGYTEDRDFNAALNIRDCAEYKVLIN